MLKVKLTRYKTVVMMEILEQDERIRNKGIIFNGSNGLSLASYDRPALGTVDVYLRGQNTRFDDCVAVRVFNEESKAVAYMFKVEDTIKEYNESLNEKFLDIFESKVVK